VAKRASHRRKLLHAASARRGTVHVDHLEAPLRRQEGSFSSYSSHHLVVTGILGSRQT
jgi:hypothetical protein